MRVTKRALYSEFRKVVDEFQQVTEELYTLVKNKQCHLGALLVHSWYEPIQYRYFMEHYHSYKRRHTPVLSFQCWLEGYKECLQKAREFIERVKSGEYEQRIREEQSLQEVRTWNPLPTANVR